MPWLLALLCAIVVAACSGDVSRTASERQTPQSVEIFPNECSSCHGSALSPAPPHDLEGSTDPARAGNGAHLVHLGVERVWRTTVQCSSCHVVPSTIDAPGHIDGDDVAEVVFGPLAKTTGLEPVWNGETCSNVYCHGATLTGGVLTAPAWMATTQVQICRSCHGDPPPEPHPQNSNCGSCHQNMLQDQDIFLDPTRHINGIVEVLAEGETCDSCHGAGGNPAPPPDLSGNTSHAFPGVGVHQAHMQGAEWHRQITCSSCHEVPMTVQAPGHLDGDHVAEVHFNWLNPAGSFDRLTNTCSSLYCHGDGQASNGERHWTRQEPMECNSCHASDPARAAELSDKHFLHVRSRGFACNECHQSVDQQLTITRPALHIDGLVQVEFARGGDWDMRQKRCSNITCHGDKSW